MAFAVVRTVDEGAELGDLGDPELKCPMCGEATSVLFVCPDYPDWPHCDDCHHEDKCALAREVEAERQLSAQEAGYVPLDEQFRQEHL